MNDGKEVVEYFEEYFDGLNARDQDISETPLQPVSLLLLDINMPILHGLETLKLVKEMFERHNAR